MVVQPGVITPWPQKVRKHLTVLQATAIPVAGLQDTAKARRPLDGAAMRTGPLPFAPEQVPDTVQGDLRRGDPTNAVTTKPVAHELDGIAGVRRQLGPEARRVAARGPVTT